MYSQSDESAPPTPISMLNEVKCGEIFLLQRNDLRQQQFSLKCAFCDTEWLSLKGFLRHVLQNHLAVSERELEQEFEERATIKQKDVCHVQGKVKEEETEYEIELIEKSEGVSYLQNKDKRTQFVDKFERFVREGNANKFERFVREGNANKFKAEDREYEELEILEEEDEEEASKNIAELAHSTIDYEIELLASTDQQKLFRIPIVMDSRTISIPHNQQTNSASHPGKICGKPSKNHVKLKAHSKRVINTNSCNKPYKCEFCNVGFTESSNLKVHRNRHLGIKSHRCELCDKRFISSSELKLHVRSHTNERPYMCSDCGQSFTTSAHLSTHRRRHLNVRPHVCAICGKSFYDKPLLRAHEASHSNARPFPCIKCHSAFSRRKALMEHMRLHSSVKKYKCKICSKAFAQNSGLHSHMRKHHGAVKLGNESPNQV